ncbi:cytochrome b561 and DOMON domain-containing protein At5g47530 [Setaria italica]|uniref:cytochrome b561 and DOMON domain-containing protein At5g47530 n=1 Tax=Setaria italica TaxID=4555 RepID=UPI0003508FDA|nr:cytochrome b561 and DOMON domain-containing protein At5g47530 [Setaria italica]
MAGRRNHSACLLLRAKLLLVAATGATAQNNCSSAKFPAGRSFQRCTSLPVLGDSLHWTYHQANGTADVAFRVPQSTTGWVAWGINTERPVSIAGSSVFIASHSQDGNGGAVSVLATYLESTAPVLANNTLKLAVPVAPAAEYSGGAYTIYAMALLVGRVGTNPVNITVQNTVWRAGPLSGGRIAPHPTSAANLRSAQKLDFLSGNNRSAGAPNSRVHRRDLREFLG